MREIGLLMVKGINLVIKYLPTVLIASAVVFMFNTVHKDQQKLLHWQQLHGTHSKLTRKVLTATESRLDKTDQALNKLQDTLYKTTLVINALRAKANTIDKVQIKELETLYRRAQLLKDKFGLHKTAAAMENKLLRKELARLKKKLAYYEKLQGIK